MVARKRKQGQARRLRKYLRDQTGTTDPQALGARVEQLNEAIARVDADLARLNEDEHAAKKEDSSQDSERDAKARAVVTESRARQRARLDDMRAELVAMVEVNRRIPSSFERT